MPVYYDNKKIIPAPLVSINKEYNRNSSQNKISANFNLQITGTLIAWKGSPDSTESFWTTTGYPPDENTVFVTHDNRLEAILRKQEALLGLFSNDGRTLEFQPLNGNAPLKCYPVINSINFAEGTWYDRCQYTINCSTDRIYGLTDGEPLGSGIVSASENWEIQFGENESVYNATHTIAVQGRDTYGPIGLIQAGWRNAKDYATSLMGYDPTFARSIGVINVPASWNAYNHVRTEQTNELDGTCNIVETWVLSPSGVVEDYSGNVNSSLDDPLITVSLDGTITGLNDRNPSDYSLTNSRWTNASGYFQYIYGNLYTRAQTLVDPGITLNVQPLSYSVVKNPIAGTIQYSYQYNNRPSNILPNALLEVINVTENYQTDEYASVPVIGRLAGPVLQDLNTKSERSRNLSVELRVMPSAVYCLPPSIQPIIDLVAPTAEQVFTTQNTGNWDYKSGRASYGVSWTFSPDGG